MRRSNGAWDAGRADVLEMREALRSHDLPVLPAVDLAACSLPADPEQASGDWFDVVPLSDGRIALVVGVVAGHGAAVAAAMSRLRAVVDELLVEDADLAATLARIDRLAERDPRLRAASVCLAAFDPLSSCVEYATCGHPPPLIVGADGRARSLAPSGAGPLGTRSPIRTTRAWLRRDETVLLHTDVRLADRLARLAERGRRGPGHPAPEQVCRRCLDARSRFGRHEDLTVLAVRQRAHPTEPLVMCAPATVVATREVRRTVTKWLSDLGAGAGEIPALELAVGELTANVARHAYPPGSVGDLWIRAELDPGGVLHIDIGDEGEWREPDTAPRRGGRGLWLAGEMVDALQVRQGDGEPGREGTVVHLHRRLRRECAPQPADTHTAGGGADTVHLHRDPDGTTISVFGPVDADTAPRFAELLNRATRGGVHPSAIDLSAVPTLSGAGVRVLFDLRDRLRGLGHPLTVQAVPGTSAYTVLELAGLSPGVPAGMD